MKVALAQRRRRDDGLDVAHLYDHLRAIGFSSRTLVVYTLMSMHDIKWDKGQCLNSTTMARSQLNHPNSSGTPMSSMVSKLSSDSVWADGTTTNDKNGWPSETLGKPQIQSADTFQDMSDENQVYELSPEVGVQTCRTFPRNIPWTMWCSRWNPYYH